MIARPHRRKGVICMEKKKILKIILVIILVLLVLFLINTFRKYFIIKDLQRKLSEHDVTNYHTKTVTTEENNLTLTFDYYQKDEKQAEFMERDDEQGLYKMSMYNNGERTDIFYDTPEEKTVQLDAENMMIVELYNNLETENSFETFIGSITAKIKKTECNGKQCYLIRNFHSTMFLMDDERSEIYIEKATGLLLKSGLDNIIAEKEYEFGNVEDSIFTEPDIGQYRIQQEE